MQLMKVSCVPATFTCVTQLYAQQSRDDWKHNYLRYTVNECKLCSCHSFDSYICVYIYTYIQYVLRACASKNVWLTTRGLSLHLDPGRGVAGIRSITPLIRLTWEKVSGERPQLQIGLVTVWSWIRGKWNRLQLNGILLNGHEYRGAIRKKMLQLEGSFCARVILCNIGKKRNDVKAVDQKNIYYICIMHSGIHEKSCTDQIRRKDQQSNTFLNNKSPLRKYIFILRLYDPCFTRTNC